MQEIFKTIRSVAKSSSSILITGQSGTGKELVARAIHECSERAKKPFLVINCAATPDGLMASELFGHVKGAFTGAITDRQGFFAAAHGGTIFIDEVGDMSLAMQVKILRVLQEGEIKPVGSTTNQLIDVRVIAATNHELVQLIRQNQFREDLYYRLNVIHIHLPMLRERTDDIPLLAYHFLGKFSRQLKKNVYHISVDALQTLQNYHWPGNIRELENIIERSIILAAGDTIQARILPAAILSRDFYHRTSRDEDLAQYPYQEAKRRALNIFNNSYIMDVLQKAKGNISAAAELAGMDRSNFKKIIKKYKIDPIRIE